MPSVSRFLPWYDSQQYFKNLCQDDSCALNISTYLEVWLVSATTSSSGKWAAIFAMNFGGRIFLNRASRQLEPVASNICQCVSLPSVCKRETSLLLSQDICRKYVSVRLFTLLFRWNLPSN